MRRSTLDPAPTSCDNFWSGEAAAEGESEAVERFEHAIRHGPRGARVDGVDVDDTVPSGRATGFTVT